MKQTTDLDAVQQLCDAATPGPWTSRNEGSWPDAPEHRICVPSKCPNRDGEVTQQDIEFAIAARTLVPQMAEEIRELRAELAAERATVASASEFLFTGPGGEVEVTRAIGEWIVWDRHDTKRLPTREEAIAHARRLAAGGEESGK